MLAMLRMFKSSTMSKNLLISILLFIFLNNCSSYSPIIDSKGKAKFMKSNAQEITNDIILCKELARKNTTFLGNITFWLTNPRAETQTTDIIRKCLKGRNHSVMN